jgi:hypothetical protein
MAVRPDRPGADALPITPTEESGTGPRLLQPWAISGRAWAATAGGCLAVAVLSAFVLPRTVAYDPYSWLIWGREIIHFHLDTRDAATSVKPLAIAIDTLLAPAGSHAPTLWLVAARTASLLAVAMAFRLGCLIGGTLAGIVAGAALVASNEYVGYLFMQGMSEPMAAAAVLGAIDAHIRGRRGWALVWLLAAAWLRPEAWPALILYVLWLTHRQPVWRRLLALAGAVAVPLSWFAIDWFGARQFFRSANAATHQSQGGPLLTREPGLATIRECWALCSGPVVVLFLVAVVAALVQWRRSGRIPPALWLSAAAVAWLIVDAVLAQGRFATGAARYLLPGDAIACVVVGCFIADVVRAALARRPAIGSARATSVFAGGVVVVAVAAAFIPRAVGTVHQVRQGRHSARQAQRLSTALPLAIDQAGGRDAVVRCGHVTTQAFQVPLVAWQLDVPVGTVGIIPSDPGTVFMRQGAPRIPPSVTGAYRLIGAAGPPSASWVTSSTCR